MIYSIQLVRHREDGICNERKGRIFMKRWIYCFLCIIIIAVSYPPWLVMAGEDTHLVYEDLTIHLMPQYAEPEEWETDEPTVLVGIHGTLVNESEEPFSNEIRIPLPYEEPGFQFSQAGE